jgi:hypothetical protein
MTNPHPRRDVPVRSPGQRPAAERRRAFHNGLQVYTIDRPNFSIKRMASLGV